MSRELTLHRVNSLNERILVYPRENVAHGPIPVHYDACRIEATGHILTLHEIRFQKGSEADNGVNGITNEVLLAIVQDRLNGYQAGSFACRENAMALTKIEEALMWLHYRSRDRLARGVEGTDKT